MKRNELSERNKKLWKLYKLVQFDILYFDNDMLFLSCISSVLLFISALALYYGADFISGIMLCALFFIFGMMLDHYLIVNRYKKIVKER
jgi:hypothetical protein